jgi:hypothetical protein
MIRAADGTILVPDPHTSWWTRIVEFAQDMAALLAVGGTLAALGYAVIGGML